MDGGPSENDAAVAAADELFRVALTAVGQATELVLRARTEQERRLLAQARADQAHTVAVQNAQRDAARAVYLAPQQESWWANATVEDVAQAWTTARAWSQYDPQALHAQEAIARTVRRRWGVDIEAVAAGGRTEPGSAQTAQAAADAAAAADDIATAVQRQQEEEDLDTEAEDAAAEMAEREERERDARPATERQMAYIRDRGLDPGHPLTVGEATQILTEFEAAQRASEGARAVDLAGEAERLVQAEVTELAAADVEQGGTHPGSGQVEIHQDTADRLDSQGRAVAAAAVKGGAAAGAPRPAIPQQAAAAKKAAAPGFPLAADAAVRMGPGKATMRPPAGPRPTQERDQDRSR